MQTFNDKLYSGVTAVACALAFVSAGALADVSANVSAIGTLESEAPFQVRSADAEQFVRIRQSEYSWFSGDTVRVGNGVAVLNLNTGGGFGFHDGTEASVALDAQGRVTGEILAGKVLYALPENAPGMELTAGNFTLSTESSQAERIDVARGGEFVGEIQRLEDGHVKVSVTAGTLNVVNGRAAQVQVSAGETLGLLDVPETQAVRVQSGEDIAVTAPQEIGSSQQLQISWQGAPPTQGDYIVIAPKGAPANEFDSVVSITEGQQLEFTAPSSAGDYEIRVIDRASGAVKSSQPLVVTAQPAAAAAAGAGGSGGGGISAAGAAITVAAAGAAVYIGVEIADDDDDDDEPVSP